MEPRPIRSRMAIAGHPIHPMLIHFPVAALLGLVVVDLAYLYTQDAFWMRAGLWLAGIGALAGWLAAAVGLIDLLTVPAIRRLITAWCHALMAVMMLSLASLNWLLRFKEALPLQPWGIYLSLLTAALIAAASVLGGQLVYGYAVGVQVGERETES
ncbi:DUF2231 domain-containing protein [Methylohalobius crimeensis]|uniref:DUF2231 domain-containing protein n=1 Tax=Methylohalobius crimeensis TaxID=244365 RepID=UPI0003B3B0FD|nr:DUF2231 domain-containing protein [Methylohalobius crimeensis]